MNKSKIIKIVAKQCGITIKEADLVINSFMDNISECLKSGEDVTLYKFGNFSVREREAREMYNPVKRKKMNLPARQFVRFTSGEKLKIDNS